MRYRSLATTLVAGICSLMGSCTNFTAATAPANTKQSGLVINEVLSNNTTGDVDSYGEKTDWIELYNSGDKAVNLSNYALSDNPDKPLKWQFGDTVLQPGAYLAVRASSREVRTIEPIPESFEMGFTGDVYGASDAENEPIAGVSYVGPWEYKNFTSLVDGKTRLSAKMLWGDNTEKMGWEGFCELGVGFPTSSEGVLSRYTEMILNGYIDKGKTLKIGLCHSDWELFEAGMSGNTITIIGTGEQNGQYRIPLNLKSYDGLIDLKKVNKFVISLTNVSDTIHFHFNSMTVIHRQNQFHTGFELSPGGEPLILSTIKGELVDQVNLPALPPDISYGRDISDRNRFVLFNEPTPEKENRVEHFVGVAQKPVLVTAPGFYNSAIDVVLSAPAGAKIFYTVNGVAPTRSSPVYRGPLHITKTTTIRSIAGKDGEFLGKPSTATYFVNEPTELPVFNITVDSNSMWNPDTGMCVMGPHASQTEPYVGANFWDQERELPAHLEFYENGHKKVLDFDMGLKIHGCWSRASVKKAFTLKFSDKYGTDRINYPIFPNYPALTMFKSLILRQGGGHDKDVLFFDALNTELMSGRAIDYQKSRMVTLLINGEYYGLFDLRESINGDYFTTNYGIPSEEVSLIKNWGIVTSGSASDFIALNNYISQNGAKSSEHYAYIKQQMDIENYIDMLVTEIFCANTDFPSNNIKWWRDNRPAGKWRWAPFDTDGMMGDEYVYNFPMLPYLTSVTNTGVPDLETAPMEWTLITRKLLENSDFKAHFLNRSAVLFATNLSPKNYQTVFDRMYKEAMKEHARDFKLWKFDEEEWTNKVTMMTDFGQKRSSFLIDHYIKFFKLAGAVELSFGNSSKRITIDDLDPKVTPFAARFFKGVPITLTCTDSSGFKGWSDGVATPRRVLTLDRDTVVYPLY